MGSSGGSASALPSGLLLAGPASGEYLTPAAHFGYGGSNSEGFTANKVMFAPVWNNAGRAFSAIVFRVASATGGAVPRLGIYQPDTNGKPGALVAGSTVVGDATSNGYKEVPFSGGNLTLAKGLYWLAYVNQGAAPSISRYNSYNDAGVFSSTQSHVDINAGTLRYVQTGVSGALPASATPTVEVFNNPPVLALKAA